MNQRVYEISLGLMIAMTVIAVWRLFNRTEHSLNISGLWSLFCLLLGSGLLWMRKLRARPANHVLSDDQRPPVLYLRSFKDDELTSRPIRETGLPVPFTEEEYLVEVLRDFGPCIAIGQPGESLPDLGAVRIYLADDAWQDKVRELLISSKLVVLRAGKTPNFLWEVEQGIRSARPQNIIILIPRMKNVYRSFRKLANRYFPKSLPERIEEPNLFMGIASLHGYLYFDEDWTPHFVEFRSRTAFWSRPVSFPIKYVIQASLSPIYERFGIAIPKPEYTSLGVVLISFLLAIIGLFILGI
jgi:hypothetical protein